MRCRVLVSRVLQQWNEWVVLRHGFCKAGAHGLKRIGHGRGSLRPKRQTAPNRLIELTTKTTRASSRKRHNTCRRCVQLSLPMAAHVCLAQGIERSVRQATRASGPHCGSLGQNRPHLSRSWLDGWMESHVQPLFGVMKSTRDALSPARQKDQRLGRFASHCTASRQLPSKHAPPDQICLLPVVCCFPLRHLLSVLRG